MTTNTSASNLLREARDRACVSQRSLAEFAGTAQSVVGRIEARLSSPTIDTLIHLLNSVGFDVKFELVPMAVHDPVVDAYKPGVDKTLLIENLRRSVDERLRINTELQLFGNELRRAMRVAEGTP